MNDFDIAAQQGPLWDRYQVYLANTEDKYPLTFDEWLDA